MILLIAYGNSLRQDDGAGLRLAEQLARRWRQAGLRVRHLAVMQLTPELAVDIAAPCVAAVVLVDTRAVTPDTPTPAAVEVTRLEPARGATPSLGHHFDPAVLMAYAALLMEGHAAPPAWLVTAPGVAFAFEETLSREAAAALQAALDDPGHALRDLQFELINLAEATVGDTMSGIGSS